MANPNTEYEQLVARILQGMLQYDGFENLRVEHNVTLVGKSKATHQIDVFWEFKAAGVIYRTCVECKNYSSAVKKSHVAAFAATLTDIGNANGIIATTGSFQKGAKLLAEQNNIRLVLINNLLKTIHFTIKPRATNYSDFHINFNQDSIRLALTRKNLTEYNLTFLATGDDALLDQSGSPRTTFNKVLNSHPKIEGRNRVELTDLYLDISDLGLLQVDSIEFNVTYVDLPIMESIIESPNSAIAVIEEIVGDNRHYLHDDGSVNQTINKISQEHEAQ